MDLLWIKKMSPEKSKALHELHILLENDLFDKLEAVKTYYGIKNTTEVIRFLITKKYRKINKENSD